MTRILLACAALVMTSAACAPSTQVVHVLLRHSRFEPGSIAVRAGVPVTFILKNADPIDHEWIVGDEALHVRHRAGTEPVHDTRPNEVTVPALGERRTTLTFPTAISLTYICHLPGHERYGMVGLLAIR